MKLVLEGEKFILHTDYTERFRARSIGARWNKKRSVWECRANLLMAEKLQIIKKPGDELDQAMVLFDKWNEEPPRVVPQTLLPPAEHQIVGVSQLLHKKRYCIFCEMGTGKTYIVIATGQELFQRGELDLVVVVAPLSVLYTWERQIKEFCAVPYRTVLLAGTQNQRIEKIEDVQFLRESLTGKFLVFALINYDAIHRYEEDLAALDPRFIAFDESTKIKNRQAKMTQTAISLADEADYVTVLTGTPIGNNVGELFSQCRVVSAEIFGESYWDYVREFAIFGGFKNKQIIQNKNLDRLERLLDKVSLRVTKEEVLDLPKPAEPEVRMLQMKGDQLRAYTKAEKDFYFAVEAVTKGKKKGDDTRILIRNAIGRLLRCQQIAAGHCKTETGEVIYWPDNPKTKEVVEIVQQAGEQKVVFFSRFLEDLRMGMDALEKVGVKARMYSGEQSRQEREDIEKEFQDRASDLRVVLVQVQTGGMGLDLTAGSVCVFITNWFSWHIRDQAESRLDRPGQTLHVKNIDLVCDGTVDDHPILTGIHEKKSLSEVLFGKGTAKVDEDAIA